MRSLLLSFGFISVLSACTSGYVVPPPPPEKTFYGASYSASEEKLAHQAFADKTPFIKNDRTLTQNEAMMLEVFERLRENGKEICAEVNVYHDGCKWLVLNTKKDQPPNIYPWGNRSININESMFVFIRNEDEMAYVLSHEMAHLLARHLEEKADGITNTIKFGDFAASMAGVCIACFRPINHAGQRIYPRSSLLNENSPARFSNGEEKEADYIAMYLVEAAGYDFEIGRNFLIEAAKNIKPSGSDDKVTANYFDTHAFEINRLAHLYAANSEVKEVSQGGKPLIPIGEY